MAEVSESFSNLESCTSESEAVQISQLIRSLTFHSRLRLTCCVNSLLQPTLLFNLPPDLLSLCKILIIELLSLGANPVHSSDQANILKLKEKKKNPL